MEVSPAERLLGSLGDAGAALASALGEFLREVAREVVDAYDSDPGGMLLGSPAEARAWRELRDHGDAEHFLRVFGAAGEGALIERIGGVGMPADELASEVARRDEQRLGGKQDGALTGAEGERDDDPPCFDWMTVYELCAWRQTWVAACKQVSDYRAERAAHSDLAALARGVDPGASAEAFAVGELNPADLLLLAAAAETPRGFAAGDEALYRRLQALRKRVRRRAEKNCSAAVSE